MTTPSHSLTAQLRGLAAELNQRLSDVEVSALDHFCSLFARWNSRINLAASASAEFLVDRHLIDAFAARPFIRPGDSVVDVGSGGGLPALPLALLCEDATFELWEPRAKRVAFLRTAVRELKLQSRVIVVAGRVDLDSSNTSKFAATSTSVAMSRATWSPSDWLNLARVVFAPHVRVLVFTTEQVAVGLPSPTLFFRYGPNRELCVYDAGEGRGEADADAKPTPRNGSFRVGRRP